VSAPCVIAFARQVQVAEDFSRADFEGGGDRRISQPRWEGQYMFGADYFVEHALPNFFFHTTHCYAILRHNGVPLGKRDFSGR
jgi:uncharacterized protein